MFPAKIGKARSDILDISNFQLQTQLKTKQKKNLGILHTLQRS